MGLELAGQLDGGVGATRRRVEAPGQLTEHDVRAVRLRLEPALHVPQHHVDQLLRQRARRIVHRRRRTLRVRQPLFVDVRQHQPAAVGNRLSPRGRRDDMPPPAANGSSTRGGSTPVRGRVRSPPTTKLQAASVPVA